MAPKRHRHARAWAGIHVFLLRGKKPWIPELWPLAGLGHDAKTKTLW
jgi:hypothetical protein